jgi:hypothetical protein
MKKIIRENTFETNSSSSHALIIGGRKESKLDTFPRNSEYIYHLAEYGVTDSDERQLDIAKLYSEVDKARFMINIIVSHIEDSEQYPEVNYWLDWPNRIENPNRTFETLIRQKPFVWLKEVIEKETGTEFEFEEPENDYFPYYRHFYLDDYDVSTGTGINFYNEGSFKERVRDIIFNPEIIITDADIPYSCNVDIEDL